MIDVLLTHSNHLYYDPKQVRKMLPYPPLGTLYAAALLRQHGFSVALFDAMLEDPERGFPAALRRHQPQIVAAYEDNFNYLSKMCLSRMREVTYGMIDAARASGARVLVNGSDVTDHTQDYLQAGADYVLLGEAERTLLELVGSLLQGSQPGVGDILGLAYRCRETGSIIHTPRRPLVKDIDQLPSPARDLVDMEQYRRAWKSVHGFFSLNLVASRGCPYHCNWCAKPIYGQTVHVRSAASVAEEMKELKEVYGAECLWFADDVFGLEPDWIVELADQVTHCVAAVAFKMQTRVNFLTERNVSALRRAGCVEVWLGAESGSQRILDAMEKGVRVEDIFSAREILRRHGIRACYFLQFGYPGEEWEHIQQTIQLVRQTRPDDIGVSVSYPLPGTGFYERVRSELGEKKNWVDSDDLAVMFKATYRNEFYRVLRDALHAEVDLWSGNGAGGGGAYRMNTGRLSVPRAGSARLWQTVEQLEQTCRNANPTLGSGLPNVDPVGEPRQP